jgi:hypothetical protein
MTPVFGLLQEAENALAELVHNCLLVAGGFLVGYFLGMAAAWAVGRYVFKQRDNAILKKLGGLIGGLVLALIVALVVFTGRGKGPGTGGDGKGTPSTDPDAGKNDPPAVRPDPKLPKTPEVKPADAVVRVTVYGGAIVSGDKYYRVDDDPAFLTLSELKAAIEDRKAAVKGRVTVAILYPANKDHAPGNPGPGQLHKTVSEAVVWANEQGYDVTFPSGR